MTFRYLGMIITGVISLLCVYFFGIGGMYSLNLAILLYFVPWREPDEREKQLNAKVYNITFGLLMILLINIYVLSQFVVVSDHLKSIWVGLVASGMFIILGTVGLVVFHKE
ncbi:MAG: hypothetical protein J7K89_01685 [Candidatus Cloacimonetes bacterium]|nr:hypothetical protein [Candidatus Cloacimonadota bacterium]